MENPIGNPDLEFTQIIDRVYPALKHCLDCVVHFIQVSCALEHEKYHIPKIFGDPQRAKKFSQDYIQGNMGSSENSLIEIRCQRCLKKGQAYFIHFNPQFPLQYKTYCSQHCPSTDQMKDNEVVILLNQTPSQIGYNNKNYSCFY